MSARCVYAQLGFETVDVHVDDGTLTWARVHCEGGAIMFLRSDESDETSHDRILLYLYTPHRVLALEAAPDSSS